MGAYNMFTDLKTPRDLTGYTLFRGTTDFSQLQQFDLFESGYPYLIVVSVPDFLQKMADKDSDVAKLLNNYVHILEYEFRGFQSGLENLTGETSPINNGFSDMNVITKTTGQSAQTFSMNYYEKSGSTITKMHELYLRSIRDPGSGFKHYNGLIGFGADQIQPSEAGFHKECFSFLYIHTDNTGMLVENATYIVGAMPTTSELSIYNGVKGDVQFHEIGAEFSGFPIRGKAVNERASAILNWMNNAANAKMVQRNSWDYKYDGTQNTGTGLAQTKLVM